MQVESLQVLSLGAGTQSSTLALMAAVGEIEPMPDAAIFADTYAEPAVVYAWLDWLEPRLPFPVYRVSQPGGLAANVVKPLRHGRFATVPAYTLSAAGVGQLRRQCTRDYKIVPINRKLRELLGLRRGQRTPRDVQVSLWIGISLDEVARMKPNREAWIENRWPLIEKRMTRVDCLDWMARRGYPKPPRSACVFCPYRSDSEWRDVREQPESWQQAVEADELIRAGVRLRPERLYLHRSLKPLTEVDLTTEQERGQLEFWGNVCDGYCAV